MCRAYGLSRFLKAIVKNGAAATKKQIKKKRTRFWSRFANKSLVNGGWFMSHIPKLMAQGSWLMSHGQESVSESGSGPGTIADSGLGLGPGPRDPWK